MTTGLSEAKIRLRTLGSVDLRAADGTQIHSVLRQPRRLALLIYLALNGPGFQRRDRLLGTFWPESSEERARANLAQQVFQLRHALGKDAIVGRGDEEIGLSPDRVWCDAVEFDALLRSGRTAEAMELYTGELLPGFIIDDAPEFERWLDEERARRANEAANACAELSESAERSDEPKQALHWMRRVVALQPYSETAYQRLIALLDRCGDRAAALRAYDELRERLRQDLETEPSAETNALIQAVRARAESKRRLPETAPLTVTPHVAPAGRRDSGRRIFAGGATVLVIAALIWGVVSSREPARYRPPANHVAVLYFSDQSPTQDLEYLAEGLTSTLIDQLGQVKQIQVISQNGVRPFRGASIPLDSIARQLDVGTLVGGNITSSNDLLRVTVQLIDGSTGVVMHSRKLERPQGELFALLDEVSSEVAAFLRSTLGAEIRLQQWKSETRSQEAWELLSRAEFLRKSAQDVIASGNYIVGRRDLEVADSLLIEASRLDRGWAAPYVRRGLIAYGRAWTSTIMDKPPQSADWLRRARELADRALKVDAKSYAAFELRGVVNFTQTLLVTDPGANADSLLREAERDLVAALKLQPDLPYAESQLSAVYFVQGRFDEARRAAQRALEADAYLTSADEIVNRLFHTSFELGDDQEAGYWCDEIRRRMPNRWPAAHCDLILLAWGSLGSPDPRKALHLLEQAGSGDTPEMQAFMRPQLTMLAAAVLARAGQADSARALAQRARAAAGQNAELLYLEAAVRLILREKDVAKGLLEEYYRVRPNAKPGAEQRRILRPLREADGIAQRR